MYTKLLLVALFSIVVAQDLRWNQFQTLGTHNSYHLLPPKLVPAWNYSHPVLSDQLSNHGFKIFVYKVILN